LRYYALSRTLAHMAKKKKRPELIHCKVRLSTHPKAPWRVSYKAEREGREITLRKSYAKEDDAWNFAVDKEQEISNHGVRYGNIPPEARRAIDFYRDERAALEELGAKVPKFEDLITNALDRVRAEYAALRENAVPVAEAVADFLSYKQTRVGARQLSNLKIRLRRFAKDMGQSPIASITTADIDEWLTGLRNRKGKKEAESDEKRPLVSALSRNHYRAVLHSLFKYAAAPARQWCPRNPVADLDPERYEHGEPEAYSTKDAAKLMQTALNHVPDLVPILALGLFCGLRSSEAESLDLAKLPDDGDEFRVTGKTGPRLAPYTPAARAWIVSQPRRTGKAWAKSQRHLASCIRSLYELAEVKQIHNGARHSFISYRTAECRDVARVADECGNSVATIKNHYRQLVTSDEALKYFAIRPETKADNITEIAKARRASA
jgi:integrase